MADQARFDEQALRSALSSVKDPELGKDLLSLGVVRGASIDEGLVRVQLELASDDQPLKERLAADIRAAIERRAAELGVDPGEVAVAFKTSASNEQGRETASALPNVRHVIAVGAGKGGVGKSTVSVNLALGLARTGARVGLLDGDIYGPSIPTMLGLDDDPPALRGSDLLPFEAHGIKTISIGKLVDPDKPLIWRGPMAHGAFKQLALQTDWGPLDYLIVDLPPGTGDIP